MKKERNFRYMRRMYGFMRPFMFTFVIGTILFVSQQFAVSLIYGNFSRLLLDGILAASPERIVFAAIVMIASFGGFGLLLAPGVYMHEMGAVLATREMKRQLFQKFVNNSLEASQAAHSGEGIAAINTDADTAAEVFGQPMAFFFGMILTTILSAITVLIIDWRLGLGAMAIGALAFLIQIGFAPVMARLETRRLEENANSIKSMSNIFSGAAVIRAFGIEAKAEADLTQHVAQMQKIGMRGAWINMFRNMFTTIEGWLTMLLVFGMGGWLVARGELDLPMLLLILPMASSLSGAFAQIGTFWALLQPPMAACKRVFEILDKPGGGSRQRNILGSHWDGDYSIKVRDMNFRYLDGTLALRDIRLDIGKNKMVAFVGPSGSGKSTLLRAIIGMYERSDLGLTLGNLDFATASPTMWRARFAYVDQSHKLFDMTIAENIALGALNTASQNDIEQAAIRAYAHDFIAAIGYDADAGERGAALSGGEKQRIAIARALVKGAPILVFDEATSALDSESEQNIMDTINRLRPDHTILIATHNLAAITTADRIVVMNHGQIAEMGTHDSLMRKNGLYSNLFKDQKS